MFIKINHILLIRYLRCYYKYPPNYLRNNLFAKNNKATNILNGFEREKLKGNIFLKRENF